MATDSILKDFILIYLDDEEDNCLNISILEQFVHLIYTFTDCDRCFDYITDIKTERIFLIISDRLSQQLISIINEFESIESIYILSKKRNQNETWIENHSKIKGIYSNIQPIYEAIRRDLRQYQDDHIPISIYSSNKQFRSDQLIQIENVLTNHNFNYTEIDFIEFCQGYYSNNEYQLELIRHFQNTYLKSMSSIQWFTRDCFLVNILNKAIRIRDSLMLERLTFFIQNLHEQIRMSAEQIHLVAFRFQLITAEFFQSILENSRKFLIFHHFLIITTDRELALDYARVTKSNGFFRVIFQMEIDGLYRRFIPLNKFKTEYLLTINTIFRIDDVKQIENDVWSVTLKLTKNENSQIKQIRRELNDALEHFNSQDN